MQITITIVDELGSIMSAAATTAGTTIEQIVTDLVAQQGAHAADRDQQDALRLQMREAKTPEARAAVRVKLDAARAQIQTFRQAQLAAARAARGIGIKPTPVQLAHP